ncbi:MAG TPA: phenylpyruvate tautomerase MIF-related protein [Verrucomicrobiae bacterium]|nr:phenylpyruvate tautomerase MIF-related protein [Verrucomicrobiae bacterium]
MPFIRITSNQIPDEPNALLAYASKVVARETGKPEAYVMVCLDPPTAMTFAGSTAPVAFFEVRGIGLSTDITPRLSAQLCAVAKSHLAVPPDRVFINFIDVPANRWGFNGETFG